MAPFGAHVLSWGLIDEPPVIWLSQQAVLDASRPIRGGIPVCLPWFGAAESSPAQPAASAPSHGFARTCQWTRFNDPELDDDPATVIYQLRHNRDDHAGVFPHSFTALYSVTAGPELVISLQVTNTDDHAFTFEEALHTYIAVGDIKDVTITGLEGATYSDKIRGGRARSQVGEVMFTGPTDRIYDSAAPLTLEDPRWLRKVTIEKQGSASTVIWNPWVEGARAISDMGDGEWTDFLCVESANVAEHALVLEPHRAHTMVTTIRSEYFI